MAKKRWRTSSNKRIRIAGRRVKSEDCCTICERFLARYNLAGDPNLEVELAGISKGPTTAFGVCECLNGAFVVNSSIGLATCVGADQNHIFQNNGTCGGNTRTITLTINGGTNKITIDATQDSGFGAAGITKFELLGCENVLDAIDDLFDGLDVAIPNVGSWTCLTDGTDAILRLA